MDVRKFVALVGLLVLLASAGCNSSENSQQAIGSETREPPPQSDKIAVLCSGSDTPFDKAIRDGLATAADEFDVEVEFMAAAPDEAEQQLTLLETAIEERCRGICIYPLDAASVVAPLEAAQQAGIPVVTFGRPVEGEVAVVSHASTDHFHAGRAVAEFCAGKLADDAMVLLVDCRSNDDSAARRNGFSFAAEKELERFEMVTVDCGEDIVASIRASLGEREDTAAVVAFNVRSSQAALEAVADHDGEHEILVCGYGAWEGAQTALDDGTLAATLLEDPYMIGYSAVMAIANHLSGEEAVGEYITTGEHVISKDKLEQPTAQRLLESNFWKQPER